MGACNSKHSKNNTQPPLPYSAINVAEVVAVKDDDNTTKTKSLDDCDYCSSIDTKKQIAISKIQRQARRKRAMKAAKAEQQWRLFAELDTQDELEMLHLAVFMQTLLDIVPTFNKSGSPDSSEHPSLKSSPSSVDREELMFHLNSDSDSSDSILMEGLTSQYSTTTVDLRSSLQKYCSLREGSMLYIDSININMNAVKLHTIPYLVNNQHEIEYNIIDLKFDSTLLLIVIEIYRQNHKLTRNSIMKILSKGYKALLDLPNVVHMTVGTRDKLTVVGDLHGQLNDLLCIFEMSGIPSPHNKYIFNGDFVDRGNKSVEVFIMLLLSLCVEGGEVVCLNRGNHEDRMVNRVYGFQDEVLTKYPHDNLLLEMFLEVFNHLPLCSVINNDVFVVHGGLFHTPELTLPDLDQIPRREFVLRPSIPYPHSLDCYAHDPHAQRREFLLQIQREALWSDPFDGEGIHPNDRGLGIKFGKDIAQRFMETNQLSMIIRSHECIFTGFAFPFQPDHPLNHMLAPNAVTHMKSSEELPRMLQRQNSASEYNLAVAAAAAAAAAASGGRSGGRASPRPSSDKSFSNVCDSDDEEMGCLTQSMPVEEPAPVLLSSPDSPYLRLNSRRSSSQEEVLAEDCCGKEDEFPPLLCTLFSASNYCGGDNFGAIMEFINHDVDGGRALATTSLDQQSQDQNHLHYLVKHYKVESSTPPNIEQHNEMSLRELILRKRVPLLTAFQVCDVKNDGQVSLSDFSEILIRITNIRIRWLGLLRTLVPETCLAPNAVKYRAFLDHFSFFEHESEEDDDDLVLHTFSEDDDSESSSGRREKALRAKKMKVLMDNMYGQRRQLETVFFFFDTNGDGLISLEEFQEGCSRLNALLPPECQLTNIDRTLQMMDFDGSGTIDINEFFETFRILDAKDGKVDGVLSIAKQYQERQRLAAASANASVSVSGAECCHCPAPPCC